MRRQALYAALDLNGCGAERLARRFHAQGMFPSRMTDRKLAQRFTLRPLCFIIASTYAKEL